MPRQTRARSLLFYRRLFTQCRQGRRDRDPRGRQLGRRRSSCARQHAANNRIGTAQFETGDVLEVLERLRADRQAVRRGDLRPAQVCPTGEGRRARCQGLLASQPGRARRPRARRHPGDLLVLGLVGRELFADLSAASPSNRPARSRSWNNAARHPTTRSRRAAWRPNTSSA